MSGEYNFEVITKEKTFRIGGLIALFTSSSMVRLVKVSLEMRFTLNISDDADRYLVRIWTTEFLILEEILGAKGDIFQYLNSVAYQVRAPFFYYLNNKKLEERRFPFSLKRGSQDVVAKEDGEGILRGIDFTAGDLEV